jgi:Immunity protein Imm1
MFVTLVIMNDIKTWKEEVYVDDQITQDLVESLVRRLDGGRHSTLALSAEDEINHMGIGGDAGVGLIVYHTSDNEEFHNLLSDEPDNYDTVEMMVGQQIALERRYLADVEKAVQAAREFVVSGLLAEDLNWEFK